MKSGIIFYFFFLLHAVGMSKVCGSLNNPNNFTSVPQMEGDGWVFSANSWPCSPSYAKITWEQSSYCECYGPGKSYCGYVPGFDNGVVGSGELTLSLFLNLTGWEAGRLTIEYGSWSSYWKVGLYLNGVLVDETCQGSKFFQMDFNDGDELMVVEWGVLLLHSIEFTCSGELATSDSSDSYSSDENIVNKTYNTSASNSLDENIVNRTHNSLGSDPLDEDSANRTYNSSGSDPLDEDIANRTYNSSGSDPLDEDITNRTYNSSGFDPLDDDIVDGAYNSSTLLYSSGDSIVPTTLLLIVTSIVILATVFLCMQVIYKAITQINWQVSVEPLDPVDKFEIQVEGFPYEPNVAEKQLQTSVQTGEPSEEGININYV